MKKQTIKTLFCALILFCISSSTFGQVSKWDSIKQTLPLSISILDESISLPNAWFLEYSYNPAIMVGTEYVLKQKPKSDWHLTGNIGFYYHKNWELAPFINSEIGYRYKINKRLNIQGRFGLGYLHYFAAKTVYTYQDGTFKEKTNFGSPTLMVSLSAALEYKLKQKSNSPVVFISFMSAAKVPFSIYSGLNQFVGIGYKFYPFLNKKNN